jgi:hypothetical protein
MSPPRDLLPRWLVDHHDGAADAVADQSQFSLQPWDDGFTPSGCDNRPCKIVAAQPRATRGVVRVVDGAVHSATADMLYESAVQAKVWGVYVPTYSGVSTVEEDVERRRARLQRQKETDMDPDAKQQYRTALARLAVDEFLIAQGSDVITNDDWRRTHGVTVWVIASACDDETEYHLDYAELLRFETNVIFPPIYGATLHVSPLTSSESPPLQALDGGGFYVNTQGLDHYRTYGYKTRRAPHKLSTDELETVSALEPGWQRVPYHYRRGILCDGDFPHFSARVRSLPPSHKRVVVGFNLFPHAIGAFVEKFPEHSDAFNRHVKLSQSAAKQQVWSLESLKKNPRQAAFVKYLARKVREKQPSPQEKATQEPRRAETPQRWVSSS